MKRHCEDCPEKTVEVCRYVFGRWWKEKSHGGEGCDAPMSEVARAWYRAGWRPGRGARVPLTVPLVQGDLEIEKGATTR